MHFNNYQRPGRRENVASANPEKVAALQQHVNDLSKSAAKPLFLTEQMKVIMKNMNGRSVLPGRSYPEEHTRQTSSTW
jgi:hypothetical protein